ncbi:hypothetical protein IMZ48_12875 [Candidatus Bathyarchaeota archaeon]|nr:hypothetical protein [Candidatus Bathyarchaeota archaeon]
MLGTRERHLESVLQSALRQLIPVRNFPRCLIQITLQVTGLPENDYTNGKFTQYNMVSAEPSTEHTSRTLTHETRWLRQPVLTR